MTRRKVLLIAVTVVVLVGAILGGIQLVRAIQGGNTDTEMTKSVARITYHGVVDGKSTVGEWCSGSVVGDGWVLTALHCLFSDGVDKSPINVRNIQVQLWRAGVIDINHPDYHSGLSFTSLTGTPYPPSAWMSNGFVDTTGSAVNYRDVALLHVATPMPSWVKTVPTSPTWPRVGTSLTEYGYGRISSDGSPPNVLMKSQQGAITRIDCPSVVAWTAGHLCISSTTSTAWGGDSGGPLLWWYNGYWQQVGSMIGRPPNVNDTVRYTWSEVDGATRNWILSYVFSTIGPKGFALGAPPSAGTILRDEVSGSSWLYKSDGYRHWIPDAKTYNCLLDNTGPKSALDILPLRTIEALPDMVGDWASCTPRPAPTSPPAPTITPKPHPSPTVTPNNHPQPTVTPAPPPSHHAVNAYDNYGQSNLAGHAMCRGNPANPLSMPGGTGTQTFTVHAGVATLSSAMVQIDPASVTAHMSIAVNGHVAATAIADAVGDTKFSFWPVPVHAGDVITLSISFTATYGKIITLYTVGNPGGTFTASNSCPDGAPNFSTTTSGLRAVVSGMS